MQGTIPRNELEGCSLAAQTGFAVASTYGARVINVILACDNTISSCWIANKDAKLKHFVHTRVKLIHRLVVAD